MKGILHFAIGTYGALVLSTAVRAMDPPVVGGSAIYRYFYKFTHILLANFDRVNDMQDNRIKIPKMSNPIDLTTVDSVRAKLDIGAQGQGITGVMLLTGGTGYANSFSVQVVPVDGNGSGAVINGTALGGVVQSLSIVQTNPPAIASGKGYTSTPLLVFPGGTGATAIAYLGEDAEIQRCITSFSAKVLRMTGRGPADGTIPASSPFATPQTYNEWYDGSGTDKQFVRNWPIISVQALTIGSAIISPSTGPTSYGYVIDGTAKCLALRGFGGASIDQSYAFGWAYSLIGSVTGFSRGTQNVNVQYTAGFADVPEDLEEAVRYVVAQTVRRRAWIDQKMQTMNGQETVSYRDWDMPPEQVKVIRYYKSRVIF